MSNQERREGNREGNLCLIQNEQGKTVGVRTTNPQVFGFKGLGEVAKKQIATGGRGISLKVAGKAIFLSQGDISRAGKPPHKNHKERRKTIRFIAAAMYKAEEVTICAANSPIATEQREKARKKMDSMLSTFTIRKPTAQELILIIQNWQENNGKGITLAACGTMEERYRVTLTPKNRKKILAEAKALDAFAKIPIEVTVHKST